MHKLFYLETDIPCSPTLVHEPIIKISFSKVFCQSGNIQVAKPHGHFFLRVAVVTEQGGDIQIGINIH